jgi:hypothetical protein
MISGVFKCLDSSRFKTTSQERKIPIQLGSSPQPPNQLGYTKGTTHLQRMMGNIMIGIAETIEE